MRYQGPRKAAPSGEKGYDTRPTPAPKIRQGVIRGKTIEKEENGYSYEYHEFNAPMSKEGFDRLTNKKYTNPRGS